MAGDKRKSRKALLLERQVLTQSIERNRSDQSRYAARKRMHEREHRQKLADVQQELVVFLGQKITAAQERLERIEQLLQQSENPAAT